MLLEIEPSVNITLPLRQVDENLNIIERVRDNKKRKKNGVNLKVTFRYKLFPGASTKLEALFARSDFFRFS